MILSIIALGDRLVFEYIRAKSSGKVTDLLDCTPSTFKRGPSCLPCHQKMFKIIFKERLTGQAVDD